MLDRHNARRLTHASQAALAVLVVAGAAASTRNLRVEAKPPDPPTTPDANADPGYQVPVAPPVDVAIISEGLTRPAPPAVDNPEAPVDTPPDDPDPGDQIAAGSDELRYLGSVIGGGKRMALVAMGDRQKLVPEGRDFDGLEVVSVTPDRLVIRDDTGEREVAKSRRSGSRFTEISVKGGDPSSDGARELSRRENRLGGVREDMRRRIEDLQRAAARENVVESEALDDQARDALDEAMNAAAAEARRAADAKRKAAESKRKPQPPRPTPGEQGP